MTWDNKFNKKKYRVVDGDGNSYGEFREKANADKKIVWLKKELWIDTILEDIE